MNRFSLRFLLPAAALALVAFQPASQAQTYPTRPVTIIVPLAAGSGLDAVVRLYADKLQTAFGQPVVVENKPGAALMLAAQYVSTQPADGYTLLVSTSSAMAINLALYKSVPYDVKQFTPVSYYLKAPFVLIVDPKLPARTVPELIQLAKSSPTQLTFSSPGAGTALHLSGEYMKSKFGLNMTHVPYKSTPQSIQDVVAGHVSMSFAEVAASLALIKDGKLRALAVTTSSRLPQLPDIPTFAEAAPAPGFEAVSWHMLFARADVPRPVIDKIHSEMNRILADPEMRKKITDIGLLPIDPPSIADTEKYLVAEREKWGTLVKQLGLEGSQ